MSIDNLTIKELKEILSLSIGANESPYHIGKNYFIRTVTMIQIGRLVGVTEKELVLEDAVWVADAGRFTQAFTDGALSEVELFPKGEVIVGRGSVIDACVWDRDLPKDQV